MLPPVCCFSCGYSLGDIAPIYNYIRQMRMEKKYGQPGSLNIPGRSGLDPTVDENIMADVLAALNVTASCCKIHLVTAMNFTEIY